MKIFKKLYSIVMLGSLFVIHIFGYLFVKRLNGKEFVRRFELDNIDIIGDKELNKLYEASRCICCDVCCIIQRESKEYDGAKVCASLTRDPTQFRIMKSNVNYSVEYCPYELDVKKVSTLIP